MLKRLQFFLLVLLLTNCIEPYNFVVIATESTLVVEAFLSDKSFNETVLYPSDGRYFNVKLSETGDVTNKRAIPVSAAAVRLISDEGGAWEYTESDLVGSPGLYTLFDNDFKAKENVGYKLQITLTGEKTYESTWERMPSTAAPVMGEIGFTETDVQSYAIELDKQIIKTIRGMMANIQLPKNNTREPIYYRWKFAPMWIYQAPLPASSTAGSRCWVRSNLYLRDYEMQLDIAGEYTKDLFFMPTIRNERIFEDFSVLITQQSMTEPYYSFWKEMQEQTKDGAVFDAPPFNLQSNMASTDGVVKVVGYFGVIREQAKRWYFNHKDLSYFVENTLRRDCTVPFQDVAPECFDCREYSFGEAVNIKPSWWR
ncbi:MAG: DUF4249 domain-containing protein [Cyclobacteriaceae bacterium]|nr:DUF4249 domain-containing protein [Cyclobacteriaceae bacterium]MDH4295558.1 DUF4249 domain-containing protein [Cyclobacteriaceae bacterium]MDH5249127.1 DUF4249 domain-containing protein [Cyclobacteriaceae bacterium]